MAAADSDSDAAGRLTAFDELDALTTTLTTSVERLAVFSRIG